MKKIFFSFAIVAIFTAMLLPACTKAKVDEVPCTPNEDTIVGGYNGDFSILGNAYSFDDSLTITNPIANDRKISIKSERLGTSLNGTYDTKNCNKIIIDTVKIASQMIESVTLSNIVAVGSGTISGNSINIIIVIKSGSALIGGLTVPLDGESLKGTFTK